VNYTIIFKLLSSILFILALAFLSCLGVAIYYHGDGSETGAIAGFTYSILSALLLGLLFLVWGRKNNKTFFRKEALAVIGLGWILSSIVGALPYWLVLPHCSFADAVFEASSGLTTTGASVFSDFEGYPKSLLFWRSLSQWIGGMGVVVFFVAILGFLGAGGKILYSNESSGTVADLDSARVQTGVIRIWTLYLILSAACTLAYMVAGMNFFDAINHMFTTLSTGGFSTRAASIGAYNSAAIEWICILFMILGGTSFLWMIHIQNKSWHVVKKNSEVLIYFLIILASSLVVTGSLIFHHNYSDLHDAIRSSLFHVVSIMTTTGFGTRDFEEWNVLTHVIFLGLMIVGGCSGSTAGGVKVARIVVGLKMALRVIHRSFSSRVIRPVKMNGQALTDAAREGTMAYLLLVGLIIFFSIPVLVFFEQNISFEGAFSGVLACFFNIGPGIGEVGPTDNYGFFHDYSKYFLSILMIMGRLELFAVLALFLPSFWKRFS